MKQYAETLQRGEVVSFRPHGDSMRPRILSGQLVTVLPVSMRAPTVGDVVLCKVEGIYRLHLASALGPDGRFQISNNKGRVNGWAAPDKIFGVVVKVEQ